jgi:hypothetical protein
VPSDVDAVVERSTPRSTAVLWPAARLSVQAQIDHLVQTGRLARLVKGSLQVSGRDA